MRIRAAARRDEAAGRIWQRAVYAVMVSGAASLRHLPRPAAMRAGAALGAMTYRVASRQRRFAERNLRLAFGQAMTAGERDRLTREVFVHFGKCLVDFLCAPSWRDLDALTASCEGWERARDIWRSERGVILLTAHLGNWEFLGRWVAAQGVPLTVVAREPGDPVFGGYIRRLRESAGYAVLCKGASARESLAKLRRGEALGLLPDQNSGDLFVPFFGVPAGTVAGPAALALHSGAAIIPCYAVREPDDRYGLLFLDPIPAEPTGDRDADSARIMTEANRALEGVVRDHPGQWLWLHNRWKAAFEPKNRAKWPAGFDFDATFSRWNG